MKDRIFEYLEALGESASSEAIAADVLKLTGATGTVADRIVSAAVEEDVRFHRLEDGSWELGRKPKSPAISDATFVVLGAAMSAPRPGRPASLVSLAARRVGLSVAPEAHEPVDLTGADSASALSGLLGFSDGAVSAGFRLPGLRGRVNHLAQSLGCDAALAPGICLHRLGRRVYPDQPLPDVGALARSVGVEHRTDRDAGDEAELQADILLRLLESRDPATTVEDLTADLYPVAVPVDFESYAFDEAFLTDLPQEPGIYIMRDRDGGVIYVGKSVSLRDRVGHYFARRSERSEKTRGILDRIWSVEVQTVGSEAEALLLEGRLIRACRPEFNTQAEVHERRAQKALPAPAVLLLPSVEADCVELFCVPGGLPLEQVRARTDLADWGRRSRDVRQILFTESSGAHDLDAEDAADLEVLRSWYGRNSDHVNCVEMAGGRTPEEALRILRDYVGEFRPEEAERVWRV